MEENNWTKVILALVSFAASIATIVAFIGGYFKVPVRILVIYIGIGAAIIILGGLISWIWSRARRSALEARIKLDEPSEARKDSAKLADEDLRLKEYRTVRDEAEKEIRPYLPANPRGAKRLINHERLYSQIAEDRQIFGGKPELTYRHLAKWVLIIEHWPRLGAALTRDPDKIESLENCDNVKSLQDELNLIDTNIRATDELVSVLHEAVALAPILGRLVRFEPSAAVIRGTGSPSLEPAAIATDPSVRSQAPDAYTDAGSPQTSQNNFVS
jgi:hypothetical protein